MVKYNCEFKETCRDYPKLCFLCQKWLEDKLNVKGVLDEINKR